jgi:hypothetical protein
MKRILLVVVALFALQGCSGLAAISQPPSKEEIQAALDIKSPVAVSAIFGHKNRADGIDIHITYQNLSKSRTIKYATFEVVLINAVGDVVTTTIRRNKVTRLEDTGPIGPRSTSWAKWKNAAYHPNARNLRIRALDIEYTDGSRITRDNISGMLSATGDIELKRT